MRLIIIALLGVGSVSADLILQGRDFYGRLKYSDEKSINVINSTFMPESDLLFAIGDKLVIEGESCIERDTLIKIDARPPVKSIFAAQNALFLIRKNGQVWVSGPGSLLGLGVTSNTEGEFMKIDIEDVVEVKGGFYHTLFLKSDGSVWSCGRNNKGQLGDGTRIARTIPVKVIENGAVAIACGWTTSLVLMADGSVVGFGSNTSGELGDEEGGEKLLPHTIIENDIVSIASGYSSSYFINSDKKVLVCGYNVKGELGLGHENEVRTPTEITSISDVTKVIAGEYYAVFLKSDGTIWSTGHASDSTIRKDYRNGLSINVNIPTRTAYNISSIEDIFGGRANHGYLKDGIIFSVGFNGWSSLAYRNTSSSSYYRQAELMPNFNVDDNRYRINSSQCGWKVVQVSKWGSTVIVLSDKGEVWAGGLNSSGQLGRIGPPEVDALVKVNTGFEVNR